jgi:hypothetical protein
MPEDGKWMDRLGPRRHPKQQIFPRRACGASVEMTTFWLSLMQRG